VADKYGTLTPEETLDELFADKNHTKAALVDFATIDNYKAARPGLAVQLKIIAESKELPPAVVVCRDGSLTPAQVKKIRDGMLNCNATSAGRTFLMFWNLKGFKEVDEAYERALDQCLKDYPAPPAVTNAPEETASRQR
jgi:hypothetical protein